MGILDIGGRPIGQPYGYPAMPQNPALIANLVGSGNQGQGLTSFLNGGIGNLGGMSTLMLDPQLLALLNPSLLNQQNPFLSSLTSPAATLAGGMRGR